MTRIAITGGRDYTNWVCLTEQMDAHFSWDDQLLVGDCPTGADLMARCWAEGREIPMALYEAEWEKYGLRAGPLRNEEMIVGGSAELLLAFPGGKGTASATGIARRAGIEIIVVE